MASLEIRNQIYRVVFRYAGRRYAYSLNTRDQTTAEGFRGGVENTLMLIQQKAIKVPENTDIVAFVRAGGRVEEATRVASRITFAELRTRYLETHQDGAMEKSSLTNVCVHLKHFATFLGERFHVQDLTMARLQEYLTVRGKKKYRGKRLSPVTLRKEVATLRAVWNWAVLMDLVKGPFPSKGLVYPKTDEKPPFMTRAEIERRLVPTMSPDQIADLWQNLYLQKREIEEFLDFVRGRDGPAWLYPMLYTAAHTGARRSELMRMLLADVDQDGGTILIREKKRNRKQRTTRRAPLTPKLAAVLKAWIAEHAGGAHLFCADRGAGAALTERDCHREFRQTVASSKWEVVRGFHVLRHSFISCLASAAIDQRIIDDIVGHQTDEQRNRYRHLYPNVLQDAIGKAFE
jgi:integrase